MASVGWSVARSVGRSEPLSLSRCAPTERQGRGRRRRGPPRAGCPWTPALADRRAHGQSMTDAFLFTPPREREHASSYILSFPQEDRKAGGLFRCESSDDAVFHEAVAASYGDAVVEEEKLDASDKGRGLRLWGLRLGFGFG